MNRIIILITTIILSLDATASNDRDYSGKRSKLLPSHAKFQFAGNIGFLSAGLGYETFGGKLNSDLLIGYVPEFIGNITAVTISQKNTFNFKNFNYQPISSYNISAGFSVNVENGRNAFLRLPEYYPDGYYSTNAITFGLFTGLKYQSKYKPKSRLNRIEYFAEVGTIATYLYYSFYNEDYFNTDIYSLALGVNLKF